MWQTRHPIVAPLVLILSLSLMNTTDAGTSQKDNPIVRIQINRRCRYQTSAINRTFRKIGRHTTGAARRGRARQNNIAGGDGGQINITSRGTSRRRRRNR